MHFKAVVRKFHALMQAGDSLADDSGYYHGCKMTAASLVALWYSL